MTQTTRTDAPTEPRPDRHAAAPAAKDKKVYRKPELAKYEQLHGIGLGS